MLSNLESAWRSSMPWFNRSEMIRAWRHDSGWKGIVSERLCAIWRLFLTLQTAESGLSYCSPLTQYATCTWGSHYLHWIWFCTYILETPLCSQHPRKRTQLSPSSGKTQQAKISPCPQSGKLHIKEWTPMNPFLFLLTQTTIEVIRNAVKIPMKLYFGTGIPSQLPLSRMHYGHLRRRVTSWLLRLGTSWDHLSSLRMKASKDIEG